MTGANRFFVLPNEEAALFGLSEWAEPVVTDAREIQKAGGRILARQLSNVLLNFPAGMDPSASQNVQTYLDNGEGNVSAGYICSHRRPWWSVRPPAPAPLLATYMGRQPPFFATNPDRVRFLNIALGLYHKQPIQDETLDWFAAWLNGNSHRFVGSGRTYQGGLEKFEPREMEALRIPASVAARLARS